MCILNFLPPTVGRIEKWESKLKYKPIIKALSNKDNKIKSKALNSLDTIMYSHWSWIPMKDQLLMRNGILEITKSLNKADGRLVFDCVYALRHFEGEEVRDFYHSILKLKDIKELYEGDNLLTWIFIGLCEKSGDGSTCELIMDLIEHNRFQFWEISKFTEYGHILLRRAIRTEGFDSEFLNIYCSKALENKLDEGGKIASSLLSKAFDKNENHSAKKEVKAWLNSKHLAVRKYADHF